jgi:hypothetical protein
MAFPGLDTDAIFKQLLKGNRAIRTGRDISLYETLMGFYHAVRWEEPWVRGLLCAHVLYAALVVATRRHANLQFALFLVTCGAVYAAQPLNGYLHRNWRALGFTQDYFDPRGVFLSCLYSAPLLLLAFAQLVRVRPFCAAAAMGFLCLTPLSPLLARTFISSCTRCACPARCSSR